MTNFNQQQFAETLANTGFKVIDNSTDAVDSQSAWCDTENGTFQITVADKWVVFRKPNGTRKDYWGSTAQILAYVRQTLKANGGIVEPEPTPEPEVEEVMETETPKTVYNEALNETTTVRPTDVVMHVWDGKSVIAMDSWMGDNGRRYVVVDGKVRGLRTAWVGKDLRVVLCGVWEEVLPEPEAATVGNDGPEFADLTPGQLDFIENAGIGDMFITPEQAVRVTDELSLRDLSPEGVTATRNAVVRHLADLATEAREASDWDAFDRYHNNMSGICAVIDLRMAS